MRVLGQVDVGVGGERRDGLGAREPHRLDLSDCDPRDAYLVTRPEAGRVGQLRFVRAVAGDQPGGADAQQERDDHEHRQEARSGQGLESAGHRQTSELTRASPLTAGPLPGTLRVRLQM